MDELAQYLNPAGYYIYYNEFELEKILNKKIIITQKHIDYIIPIFCNFNIIVLFEKYGYVFTDDDYILLIKKNGKMLRYISEDKKTNKICKLAVQQNGQALCYVPKDKKTDELCKIAVQQNGCALQDIPDSKKTDEICEIAINKTCAALLYIPKNKTIAYYEKMYRK